MSSKRRADSPLDVYKRQVEATAHHTDADLVAKVSTGLGDAMAGQEIGTLGVHLADRGW